jgi:hypothetical protein
MNSAELFEIRFLPVSTGCMAAVAVVKLDEYRCISQKYCNRQADSKSLTMTPRHRGPDTADSRVVALRIKHYADIVNG